MKKILKKRFVSIAVFLLISMCIAVQTYPGVLNVSAAWDGYSNADTVLSKISLIKFSSASAIESARGRADVRYAQTGKYSIYWADQQTYPIIDITSFSEDAPTDWTDYNRLNLRVYSSKATGASIMMALHSTRNSEGLARYYNQLFTVDWEGWKTLTFTIDSMTASRYPDISRMTRVQIAAHGEYGLTADPETELWINDIYLSKAGGTFIDDFYGDEKIEAAYDLLKDSAAVYASGANAVSEKGRTPIEYNVEYIDGVVMVPVEFFSDLLGCETYSKNGAYSITHNDIRVSGNAASPEAAKDTENAECIAYTLSTVPRIINETCYIPGAEIAELLGFSTVTDGRLLAVGTEEMKNALIRPDSLGVNEFNEIVSHEAYVREIDKSEFTPEATKIAKLNWRRYLVGDEASNDITDPDIKARIDGISRNAGSSWDKMVKDPEYSVFEDKVMTVTADLTAQYRHVRNMAYAYACYGSEYYRNEELLADIIYALDWLGEHYYNADARKAWEASTLTGLNNWFDWDMGAPEAIIDILICIEERVTPEAIDSYLKYYYTRLKVPFDNSANYTTSARHILCSALLRNDYDKIMDVTNDVLRTYLYVDDNERVVSNKDHTFNRPGQEVGKKGSGFFTDGSYVFHTFHPMTGLYGIMHYKYLVEFEDIVSGTPFEINSSLKYNLAGFFVDGIDPLVFGTTMYRSVMGRTVNPNHYTSGIGSLCQTFTYAQSCDDDKLKKELYSIVKTAYVNSPYKSTFINSLSFGNIKKFKEVMADESIPVIEDKAMSRVYYNMDRSVHERENWGFSVAMSSSRIYNYEAINGENEDGWYLGDGRTEWFIRDTSLNATATYWSTMDSYRRPGTTVDTQKRKLVSIQQGNEYLSSKDFVGGVTLDGKYGASAMHLESYHYDKDFGIDNGFHGGPAPAHQSDLVAKKSYFMLDDGVVCLGADINAKDNNNAEVLTIVDNMLSDSTASPLENNVSGEPYPIISAKADANPELENSDFNTIDGDYTTKWAGDGGEIVWDIGTVNTLGFINLAFQNGSKRSQKFELLVSVDGSLWESVYDGASSGESEFDEAFDLKNSQARYVKFVNKGNSAGSNWVSLAECSIYPPNTDGSIGLMAVDLYGTNPIYADGAELSLSGEDYDLSSASWVNFDNKCGYWFPDSSVTPNAGSLKAHWTNSASSRFELWFSHGINPTDGGYAYAILPGATYDETKYFAESGKVQILSNTKNIQAVRDLRTNITYITFWSAGTFEGITVSDPCMIIVRETDSAYELAFSDPTQKLTNATVKVAKALSANELDDFADASCDASTATITYDLTVSPGRTLECTFTK